MMGVRKQPQISLSKPDTKAAQAKAYAQGGRKHVGVPVGSVRLSINVRSELHEKLKALAFEGRTTIGKMVEDWAEGLGEPRARRRA